MNRESIFAVVVPSLLMLVCFPLQAQIYFFSPPTYSGAGVAFVADFNGDGKPDVLTTDGTLNLGNGDGTFTLGPTVQGVTSSNTILAVGDFNGDGRPDLLQLATNTLIVLLGNGDGTFQAPISAVSGASLQPIVVTDLRGNGLSDILGVSGNNLLVYLSNGNGTFVPPASYNLGTISSGTSLVVSAGDFNGDLKQDVVVSTGNSTSGQEMTFLGNGDGTLNPTPVTSPGIASPGSAAVAEFTGDGNLDLAVASTTLGLVPQTVSILVGLGNGGFTVLATSIQAGNVTAADLRGIGKQDLVVDTPNPGSQPYPVMAVYWGNGDGTFLNGSDYVDYCDAIGDINLDGKPDIIGGGNLLLGNGDGTFKGTQIVTTPTFEYPSFMVLGKFEKNSANDAAELVSDTNSTTVYIFHNNGTGVLLVSQTYTVPNFNNSQPAYAMQTSDLNGDGNLDLIISGAPGYSVLLGNGDGTFQTPLYTNVGAISVGAVVDVNNDHKPDLIAQQGSTLLVLLGNGDGTFKSPVSYSDAGLNDLLVADFNGDGNPDVVAGGAALSNDNTLNLQTGILFGNGDGTFQNMVSPASLANFAALSTADLNNDDKPDIVGLGSGGSVQVALGKGDGTFTLLPPTSPSIFPGGYSILGITDFNGDGLQDLVVGWGVSPDTQGSELLLGNGDGSFGPPVGFVIQFPYPPIVIGDLNGDGLPDLAYPQPDNQASAPIGQLVLLNATRAALAPVFQVFASGLSPAPLVAGASATSTIQITSVNGFTGNVALSCSNPPAGISCSFSPAFVSGGSGASTLTLTTASTITGGSYSVDISMVSATLSQIATLSFDVDSASTTDFQVSVTPMSPFTVEAGNSSTSTVTISSLSGFNSAVALTCTSGAAVPLPCSLNPTSVTPTGSASASSILTVNTTTATTPGNYEITLFASSGTTIHSTFTRLVVPPDFTIGVDPYGEPTSQTVVAGRAASFGLYVQTDGPFNGSINLSCAITPVVVPAPTCGFSSSSISLNPSIYNQTFTVNVITTAPSSAGSLSGRYFPPGALPLIWSLITGALWFRTRRLRHKPVLASSIVVLALALCLGCGGSSTSSSHSPGTPPGTYTVTLSAKSGPLSHNVVLKVIVQ